MRVGVFTSFAGILALAPSMSYAQAASPTESKPLPALLEKHCNDLPLVKALVPTPPEKRNPARPDLYTKGDRTLPDGIDTGTTGFILRGKCYSLIFLEEKGRTLESRLAKEGASTILSDIRLMLQIREDLLHPAYRDKTGDVLSKHLLAHAERALGRLLSLPLKDDKGRELLSQEARAQLLRSPAEIAQTLPSKQFADAAELQNNIMYEASRQNFNAAQEREERASAQAAAEKAANESVKDAKPAAGAVEAKPTLVSAAKAPGRPAADTEGSLSLPLLSPKPPKTPPAVQAPKVTAAQTLPRNLVDMKKSKPKIERAAAAALSSAPPAAAPAAAPKVKPTATHSAPSGDKVEGVIPGSYPGHTPDGKPCTVLIQKEGQWYGERVPMFKAQIIVGDLKPGSQVQDHEFAEVSFGQRSPSTSAASAIKAHTTVGELLALRREGKLLPDPVVRSKSLAGDSLNAYVESYAYKYDRAGDRRVNEKGELVRSIGTRGEATVHLVRQRTTMAAKIKNGIPTEMTLATNSGNVDQDVTSGSYEQWRKNSVPGNYDAAAPITCLTDKVASEPKSAPLPGEQH